MSRRVYEVARELGLSTKEVMGRLNEAGVEVKSNLSVVEDPAYERVFGHDSRSNGSRSNGSRNNGTEVAAPNARLEARETEAVPRRVRRARRAARKRSRERARASRALAYVLVAALAFALAAGVGTVAALMLRGDIELPGQEEPRPSEQQGDARQAREQGGAPEGGGGADQAQQAEAGAGQQDAPQQDAPQQQEEEGVARLGEEEYLSRVGGIQAEAVGVFAESHDKLVLYDALTAQDIDEMRANEAALEELAREAEDLAPPRGREDHHEVFASAIAGLHEASRTAYELANDPVAAAEVGFDGYDARVERVAGLLERSNEMLGRDHETIGDPREISPQLGATEPARGSEEAAQT